MTGAARMVILAAMRIGAGLGTVTAHPDILPVYQAALMHVMVKPAEKPEMTLNLINDTCRSVIVCGPGMGRNEPRMLRHSVLNLLNKRIFMVLDADALTAFQDDPERLGRALHADCVLTPHPGEFERLFPDLDGDRTGQACRAAERFNCTVVLKGRETVIAAPGRAVINRHATPWLSTAGAGDVLAGMIGGLIAQGMAPFEAACAGVWLHGDSGIRRGSGLVAPDLIEDMPSAIKALGF